MVTSGTVVGVVTLFLHGIRIKNDYVPKQTENSYFYYKNTSLKDSQYAAVEEDQLFSGYPYFPKCCSPGFAYETGNRECSKSKNIPIYDELYVETELVKSTLLQCPVIVDRYVEKSNLRRFTGAGILLLDNEIIVHGKYCLDSIVQDSKTYVIRICQEEHYCLNGTQNATRDWCIRKCCQDGLGFENYKCTLTPKNGLRVKFNRNHFEEVDGYALYHSSNLKCSVANWHEYQEVNFTVYTNGSLFKYGDDTEYGVDEYCLDTMHNTDTGRLTDMLVVCEFSGALHLKWNVIRVVVILTCICLAVTVILYVFYDKPQRLLISSFCTVDFIFWTMYAMRIFYVDFGDFCNIFGYIYFFFSIARLSCLNVLSCEIWLTLGNPTTTIGQTKQALFRRKLYYIAYAILVPVFFTTAFIVAHRELHPLPKAIRPYIDVASCAIDAKGPANNYGYIYLYIPVTILTFLNLILFIKTLIHYLTIRKNMINTTDVTPQQKKKLARSNKRRGTIIVKLGLVMGVTWIYYIFFYLTRLVSHPILHAIGDILMFLNIFEGLYFLLIFVVKLTSIKELLYKAKILKKNGSSSENYSTSTESVDEMPMHTFR